MLSLYAMDKSFGRSKILKSIDLQLDKKTYGLLGPNGAGKNAYALHNGTLSAERGKNRI